MIPSYIPPGEATPLQVSIPTKTHRPPKRLARHLSWLCVLLACIGCSWFAFQVFLVPQTQQFTPNWHGATWVQAPGTTTPVAYFRYAMQLDLPPDNAFVTVTASQVFRLYVNGIYIGSNTMDFVHGDTPQTYMFDVDATLLTGVNVIGLRVSNLDQKTPLVRASLEVKWGEQTRYYTTGNSWQATGDATLVHPRAEATSYSWTLPTFNAGPWQSALPVANPPRSPLLMVDPQIYERPLPTHWISASSGNGQESYYVRQMSIPDGFDDALLRIVATGQADIFINDHQYMQWNGLVNVPQINVVNYLTTNGEPAPYRNGLMLGIYDISAYIHPGINTIAVHVLAPGTTTAKVGLDALKSAMSLDILVGMQGTYTNPVDSDVGWHTSPQPVDGWTHESNATFSWPPPIAVGRPGASRTFYLPDSNTPRNVQIIPPILVAEICVWSTVAILAAWFLLALVLLRRYYPSRRAALEATSLIWLPALACEALLVTLSREPLLPQPFPYTRQWGWVLIAVVGLSALALWLYARYTATHPQGETPRYTTRRRPAQQKQARHPRLQRLLSWSREHWGLLLVMLLVIPMVCYNPTYEPYWQDELSSYYAARHIMTTGFPAFPSGFVYPKGELFSYLLALLMSIFGTTSLLVPRTISMASFLVSLPILYMAGSRLFNRRVGLLATAMLAFSPYCMTWSRQTRMYELAQLMVIIVLWLFYRALQQRQRVRPLLLASIALLAAYFSHEEVFIILPALIVCVLVGSREGRYGFPAVLRSKHWWTAAVLGATIIMAQLTIVFLTHPVKLGSDQSQRPQIQVTLDNIPYYFNLLFHPLPPKDGPSAWLAMTPFIAINSLLAVLGCVFAFWRKDWRARYCALFLLLSSCMLIFVFTMQADRYYYPLLPVLYLLAAYALWTILHALWLFARPYLAPRSLARTRNVAPLLVRLLVGGTAALLCLSVVLVPMLPLSNFNLFVSRVAGISYHRHYADYDDAATYIHAHMRPGDLVVTVAPAVTVLYYVGQVDHFFSIDRALFLFENNGHIVETTSGAHPLLSQKDFQTVLATHNRIWLISDNGGYVGGVVKNARFTFPPPDFRLVYEGYASEVYFRSDQG